MFDHPDLPDSPDYVPLPISIRTQYQMAFQLLCNREGIHVGHPEKVTIAKGAILGGKQLASGDVIVETLYEGHPFRFKYGEYVVEIPARLG